MELQLRIAEGEPLPPEVREAAISGHAIEVRLYAEDVPAGFLPVAGTLHRFAIPSGPGLRVDTGFRDGSVVSPHYDAMLAKVIAHGRTRADAARRLARALRDAEIHGLTTNRDLLVAILREPDFLAGATDTGYLTRHEPAALTGPAGTGTGTAVPATARHALVAALARQTVNRAEAPVLGTLPSGWRNVFSAPQRVSYTAAGQQYDVAYRVLGDTVQASVNDVPCGPATLHETGPQSVDLEVDGTRRVYRVHRVGSGTYVDASDGSSALTEVPRFGDPEKLAPAGSLLAPMPGLVRRVLVEVGAAVTAGQPLLVLEAMKMEQTVAAPAAGVVAELRAKAGEQVAAGQVLAVVEGHTVEANTVEANPANRTQRIEHRRDQGLAMPVDMAALAADLAAESAVTRALVTGLDETGWRTPTPAAGWDIGDQIGHLAYFDEVAVQSAVRPGEFRAELAAAEANGDIDPGIIAARYRDRTGAQLLAWFDDARTELLETFATIDPQQRLPWFGPAMSAASSLTARLMETWAHTQDIADALGVTREPTHRLRHVAHIGVGARAFSYAVRGQIPPDTPVRVELTAPDGALWTWGLPGAGRPGDRDGPGLLPAGDPAPAPRRPRPHHRRPRGARVDGHRPGLRRPAGPRPAASQESESR